ncbi:hypothetical protein [Nocardioides sp. R-C-SC26]|uniref:hypothetical protein n=1 Tax=Nocardioides sp. R-C-SC26 TaxID=2870414 RepID=UPI001E53D083|nr:hypothetical protein [Nocardioides sp. R-C-SC26]
MNAVRLGRASALVLAASGLAGVVMPERVAEAMQFGRSGEIAGRARLEVRAGLGAAYVALGVWGVLSSDPAARRAVGLAWLGAASGRLLGMAVDDADLDGVHWGSLALETGGAAAALASSRS